MAPEALAHEIARVFKLIVLALDLLDCLGHLYSDSSVIDRSAD